jgi:MoaA/NifB/PqqE/SkfB family radical SAM enzyme
MNTSYCSLAWVGITTDPDGSLRPCCVSSDKILKDDGTAFNIGIDKLETIYNSNFYKNLRKDMLNNTYISGCDTCYNNEKYGRESRRIISNDTFKSKVYTDTNSDLDIKYLDLRLGNQCNLKCRMCNPINSSMIEKELEDNSILNQYYQKPLFKNKEWFNSEIFEENIGPHLSNLVTFYMTGGEPTLVKKNYDIMQRLIDNGQNENVTLIINTNMTNTNPKFYELLKQFKKVIIQMSIDGIDDIANYIRYPTNFNDVDNTIKELISLNSSDISLKATPVIQILNLNKLVDLFEYFEKFNRMYKKQVIDIRPGFVFHPDYNNIEHLPKEYKIECFRKIYFWMLNNSKYQSIQFSNSIKALKTKCYEDKFNPSKLKEFYEFNKTLDKIRNNDLAVCNSELYSVIKDYA